jgi:hypothetical protein
MKETNSKPIIGWKACEQQFYLDALPITEQEAYAHLKADTAIIMPFARKKLDEIIGQFPFIAS